MLQIGCGRHWTGDMAVEERVQDVEHQGVDEQWANIFNNVDGAPRDLRPYIAKWVRMMEKREQEKRATHPGP